MVRLGFPNGATQGPTGRARARSAPKRNRDHEFRTPQRDSPCRAEDGEGPPSKQAQPIPSPRSEGETLPTPPPEAERPKTPHQAGHVLGAVQRARPGYIGVQAGHLLVGDRSGRGQGAVEARAVKRGPSATQQGGWERRPQRARKRGAALRPQTPLPPTPFLTPPPPPPGSKPVRKTPRAPAAG
jgi:hypothetical protein